MGNMLVARESGSILIDGTEYRLEKGKTRVDSDHVLAKRSPAEWWEDANVTYPVEQATAAPAEKREDANVTYPVEQATAAPAEKREDANGTYPVEQATPPPAPAPASRGRTSGRPPPAVCERCTSRRGCLSITARPRRPSSATSPAPE